MNKVTKQILLDNGFSYIDKTCNTCLGNYWNEYVIDISDRNSTYYISVKDISNYIGRGWNVHIDNQDWETIAYVDIETVEHFNKLMELMDIDFRLKEE